MDDRRTPTTSHQDDAIDRAIDELGREMIEFQKRMDNDALFRAEIQKRGS